MRYPIQTTDNKLILEKLVNNNDYSKKNFDLNLENLAYCEKFLQLDLENDLLNIKSENFGNKTKSVENIIYGKENPGRSGDRDESKLFNLTSRQTSLNILSGKKFERPFDIHDKVIGANKLSKKTINLGKTIIFNNKNTFKKISSFKKNPLIKGRVVAPNNPSILKDNSFFQVTGKNSNSRLSKK